MAAGCGVDAQLHDPGHTSSVVTIRKFACATGERRAERGQGAGRPNGSAIWPTEDAASRSVPAAARRARGFLDSHYGCRRKMEASDRAEEFIPAGLSSFGIEADEIELAVMGAAHQMFWPAIREMLSIDLGDLEPERVPDLSRAPEQA